MLIAGAVPRLPVGLTTTRVITSCPCGVVDDRACGVLPRSGRMRVPSPERDGDGAVSLRDPGGYQSEMPRMDQHDLVDRGRTASIVKFLKAVLHDPAWSRPIAEASPSSGLCCRAARSQTAHRCCRRRPGVGPGRRPALPATRLTAMTLCSLLDAVRADRVRTASIGDAARLDHGQRGRTSLGPQYEAYHSCLRPGPSFGWRRRQPNSHRSQITESSLSLRNFLSTLVSMAGLPFSFS